MKLALIGFMGAGKTSVAKLLGGLLDLPVIETDELALRASGRSSIAEIFDLDGEPRLRNLESAVARELGAVEKAVISCGGGFALGAGNLAALGDPHAALIVYLAASFERIHERLAGQQDRPLFRDRAAARRLYDERRDLYAQAAQLKIDTDSRTADEAALRIAGALKGYDED